MIFLVILSVLGVAAIQNSTLSSRIARNQADRNLAFQAAEAALRDGDLDVRSLKVDASDCVAGTTGCRASKIFLANGFNPDCDNGLCCTIPICGTVAGVLPVWTDAPKWGATGKSIAYGTFTGATTLPIVVRQPRYLVEYFPKGALSVYRITALGFGANESTQVMLQTTVKVR